ncbi:MAG: hypothetical protein JWP95_1329, partial [Actinotalea sp.]|nr:hypothetical protein [Actinotalea sp.]
MSTDGTQPPPSIPPKSPPGGGTSVRTAEDAGPRPVSGPFSP